MGKTSKAEHIRVLERTLKSMEEAHAKALSMFDAERRQERLGARLALMTEQTARVSAQRGLVPYVRALEAFNQWLSKRPELREQLRPILQELQIWEIRLGYDPQADFGLSVASVRHWQEMDGDAPNDHNG